LTPPFSSFQNIIPYKSTKSAKIILKKRIFEYFLDFSGLLTIFLEISPLISSGCCFCGVIMVYEEVSQGVDGVVV